LFREINLSDLLYSVHLASLVFRCIISRFYSTVWSGPPPPGTFFKMIHYWRLPRALILFSFSPAIHKLPVFFMRTSFPHRILFLPQTSPFYFFLSNPFRSRASVSTTQVVDRNWLRFFCRARLAWATFVRLTLFCS